MLGLRLYDTPGKSKTAAVARSVASIEELSGIFGSDETAANTRNRRKKS